MQSILMRTKLAFARPCLVALALLTIGCGCSIFKGKKPLSMVTASQLNWLEITYLPGAEQPPVQFSLMGSGFVRIRRGNSPLVANDFTQDVTNIQWGDIQTDQINVQPADLHLIFQSLVDRGLMREPDKAFVASASRGVPTAHINGTLNYEHVKRVAVEPELIGFIRDLLKLFDERQPAADARP